MADIAAPPMAPQTPVEVHTEPDGTVVVRLHGAVDADSAVLVQQILVHTVRRVRPLRLVVDLGEVSSLDPLHRGAIAAVTGLGDDYRVAVFIENPAPAVEAGLIAAGVSRHRIRHSTT